MQSEKKTRGKPLCKRGHVKSPGQHDCAECVKIRCAEWYEKNRAKHLEDCKTKYFADSSAKLASNKRWQKANPERARAIVKAWKIANREHVNAESRKRYQRIKTEHAKRVRSWKNRNREAWREINNAAKNRRRARIKGSLGSHTRAEWQFIVAKQRSKCAICGVAGKLEKDHRIPLALGGSDMAVNLQGLCKPCNGSKSAKIAEGTQFGIFDKISKTV